MLFKPFRPPLLTKLATVNCEDSLVEGQPPAKKQRLSDHVSNVDNGLFPQHASPPPIVHCRNLGKSGLSDIKFPTDDSQARPSAAGISSNILQGFYNVLWRKSTMKKHKTWEGDGILSVRDGFARLQDESGKEMGRTAYSSPLLPGSMISVGGKEVEVQSIISKEDFMAGKPFLGAAGKPTVRELDAKLQTSIKFNAPPFTPTSSKTNKLGRKAISKSNEEFDLPEKLKILPTVSRAATAAFKTPLLVNTIMPQGNGERPVPRHDPDAPGAIVMRRPQQVPKGKQIVDVVVDPVISCNLREHQRDGVKFLYECVMGMRPDSGIGAILADEMGMGKTLQIIALIWTLLKQNPIYNEKPVIQKALIVCPVTLIHNWKKEFRKWLGKERIGVFVVDDEKTRISDFTKGRSYSVMIIGYERLRTLYEELKLDPAINIIIADEGHRLKSAKNKSAEAIKSLPSERRIILSGTPLQNDLSEFYFMVDLVNPGLLGKMNAFKKEFETPILQSRQQGASVEAIEKGEARSQELARLTSNFIIRRSADILSKYLPPKTEYILFCKPTGAQTSVYRKVLSSPVFAAALRSSDVQLQLIIALKKICSSPSLLQPKEDGPKAPTNSTVAALLSQVPSSVIRSPGASGKLQVLDSLLHRLRTTSQEKVVIVSHYTTTLDLIGKLLTSLSYTWTRLDGSTPQSKRQKMVDKFNVSNASTCFAFLLSAKSGGVGLNLIGASRLILYDIDWNPSTEVQAMARIHRDGQRRPCWIYRLLTQGTIEEKIYQRQLTKLSLADSVVDNKDSKPQFSPEELRDLFSLNESAKCPTHDLLGCLCQGRGCMPADAASTTDRGNDDSDDENATLVPRVIKAPTQTEIDAVEHSEKAKTRKDQSNLLKLMRYQHLDPSLLAPSASTNMGTDDADAVAEDDLEAMVEDDILLDVLKDGESRVSYVFAKTSVQ